MVTWIRTSEVATKRLREHYLQSTLRQDVSYFDNVGAGEVATRIQTDTHLVQLGISEKVPVAVSFISSFVAGFVVAFIRSWKLALALTSILPCISITAAFVNIYLSRYKMQQLDHVADGGSLAEEVISTIRTVQAFGAQPTLATMYNSHIQKAHTLEHRAAFFQGIGVAVFFFVIYSAYGLSFNFGTTLLLNGEVDAGTVVSVILSILIGSFSLATLAPELAAITNARAAASKLFSTIDRVPGIDSASPGGIKLFRQAIQGEIHLSGVEFRYPSRPDVPVLRGVDLEFEAGKTTALVGASGSGKSTIVALIERFYDPTSGIVSLDGTDVRDFNLKWLRSNIGLVSQEPTLFATTIRGNVEHGLIGTGMEHLSDSERMKRVREACIKSNADTFITSLPNGYDTLVGERGFLLSGGQKQRIAIARAIVSDPKILLLDEATSALDTRSEGVVQNALEKASKGRTTIVIAHRLSTIKDADQIYVMGDGRVLEQGTHAELLQIPGGAYARLVQAQKLKESHTEEEGGAQEVERWGMLSPTNWGSPSATAFSGTTLGFSSDLELIPKTAHSGKPRWEFDDVLEKAALKRMSWSMRAQTPFKKPKPSAPVEKEPGMMHVLKRMAQINKESWKLYAVGFIAATATGMIYPAFGIVYGRSS
jgi:ATP-binding cassette, subfamily B (MDR/TAP), member 1